MSGIEFFLVFLCPWIALGLFALFKRNEPFNVIMAGLLATSAAASLAGAGLLFYLSDKGLLVFNPEIFSHARLSWEIWIALFLQAWFAGLLLYFLRVKIHRKMVPSRQLKWMGLFFFAVVFALGLAMAGNPITSHLAAIVVWWSAIMFAQWLAGSSLVWRTKGRFLVAVFLSSLYFLLVEGIALRSGLWSVDATRSLGIGLFNIPLERAFFHVGFSIASCMGLEIFWRYGYREERRPSRGRAARVD